MLVVEKGELTSGSTHHAAGLVTQFNPSATMMRFRRYSVSLYQRARRLQPVGSVRIASSADALRDLQRAVSRARALGLEAELIGPDEVLERLPFASPESLHGGVWMAEDGHVDPHIATHAVADAARALGVEIRDRARGSPAIELGADHEVRAVLTDGGRIECRARGQRRRHLGAAGGGRWSARDFPSVPVEHQHVLMAGGPRRARCPAAARASATPTTSSTARTRRAGC